MFTSGGHFSIGTKELYDAIGTYHPAWWMDNQGDTTQNGSLGIGACSAPGANTGNNAVTMRVCAQNMARSELYSNISNPNSRMWGSYVVRTQSGDSNYVFGIEDDSGKVAPVEGCTRSGMTPTGCTVVPETNFVGGVTGPNLKSGENVVAYSATPTMSATRAVEHPYVERQRVELYAGCRSAGAADDPSLLPERAGRGHGCAAEECARA